MKSIALSLLFAVSVLAQVFAQKSSSIFISGDISTEKAFTLDQIKRFESSEIGDFVITNHTGEPRGVAKQLKGFPVLRLLEQLELNSPSPRQLSEFYFIFEAIDGYKVIFSWNELFNNDLGEEVFLVTSEDGKTLDEMEEGILLISKSDIRTGRRHVKNLAKIFVKRVE